MHSARILRLVGERNAGVDVEHLRPRLDLGQRLGDDAAVVARRHFGREHLAAGRIDALADHHEAALEADDDFLGGGGDDGFGHGNGVLERNVIGAVTATLSPASGRGRAPFSLLAGARWPLRAGRMTDVVTAAYHPASRLSTGCIFGTKSRRQGARPRRTPDSRTISATYWLCR